MRRFMFPILCAAAATLGLAGSARAQATFPYDHVHLNVPDTAAAANWYEKNFGGKRITEAPDRLMYGSTRFMFLRLATAQPSAGSAVDHACRVLNARLSAQRGIGCDRTIEPHRWCATGGADGLAAHRSIVKELPRLLQSDGVALLEVGFDQADAVRNLSGAEGFQSRLHFDLGGMPRVVELRDRIG